MEPYRENCPTPVRRNPKEGDVVMLKSGGGPKMTWAQTEYERIAICYYFEDNDLRYKSIPIPALKLAEEG